MTQIDDLTPLSRQLGLSNYESRIWQALLEKGEADAQELIRTTDVPFGRVYGVLNGLIGRGMVEVQETRPKRYRPRPVGQVIDQLLRSRKAGMDSEYKQLEEAGEVAKKRFAVLGKSVPRDEVFVTVALGEEDIRTLLRDLEFSAEKEILIAMGDWKTTSRFEELVEEAASRLLKAASRGVSVKMVFAEQIPQTPSVPRGVEFLIARMKGKFQVRVYPGALSHFKIIDRRYVVIEVVDPYEPDDRVALVQVLSKKLADHMVQVFERCWRDATPARRTVGVIAPAKEATASNPR